MYGYVLPDKPNMYIKDYYEFKAYYCGICKSIGSNCGQLMRFSTSYDYVFLNAFAHNLMGVEVQFDIENCVLHPFRRSQMIRRDDITKQVVEMSNILLYYKVQDDIIDGGHKFRKLARNILNRSYRRACAKYPTLEALVREEYTKLREYEVANEKSVDKVSDTFGTIMVGLGSAFRPLSEDESTLLYQLGKWVYLIDALDDLDEDYKKGNFNVFLNAFEDYAGDLVAFKTKHEEELKSIFNAIINSMRLAYDKIDVKISEGILTNTIYMGIPARTREIFRGEQCKGTKKEKIRF